MSDSETEAPTDPAPAPEDDSREEADASSSSSLEETTLEFEDPGETAVGPPDYDYKVQLEIFEGPLDLLLYLIKRDEVLVMAANLCYIKSRTLLPKHHQPPEDDAEDEDPRWDLIRQLIEYKKFKDAATFLHRREAEQQDIFAHVPEKIETDKNKERPLAEVSIFDLIRAFQGILQRFDDEDAFNEIVDERWTVSDKIDHLLKIIPAGKAVKFSTLFEDVSTKGEVIVTFLALLELMKLNHFQVRQDSILGEIELQRRENS